jgi:hypothetical protein
MRKGIKWVAVGVMIAAIALVAVGTVSAQGPGNRGRGGMMGGGFGPGMLGDSGTYGPGMMGRGFGYRMMDGYGFGYGMMGGYGFGFNMMDTEDSMWTVLADLTGLDTQALWDEVAASDSIAAVLEAHDVTVEAAADAILAAHADELSAAVEAGNLTQEEADAMQVLMSGRITDMLTATRPTIDSSTSPWPGGRMWDGGGWHHPFFNNGTAPDTSTAPDSGTDVVPEATPEVNAS